MTKARTNFSHNLLNSITLGVRMTRGMPGQSSTIDGSFCVYEHKHSALLVSPHLKTAVPYPSGSASSEMGRDIPVPTTDRLHRPPRSSDQSLWPAQMQFARKIACARLVPIQDR